MASVTDICNAAISHCGTRSKISSIDEGSAEANACLAQFTLVRDAILRAYDWNFARMTASLAQLVTPPARWAYKYGIPVDCLRIRRLNDLPVSNMPETLFEMAADKDSTGAFISVILTNFSPLSAIYTARVEDPVRWDQGFVDAVTYELAARICFELTGKEDRARTLLMDARQKLAQGGAESASEGSNVNRMELPETLQVRGYSDGLSTTGAVERPSN